MTDGKPSEVDALEATQPSKGPGRNWTGDENSAIQDGPRMHQRNLLVN